jgi:DNA-binding PadR family transcriptional regulator
MFAVRCARDSSGIPRFFIGDTADSPTLVVAPNIKGLKKMKNSPLYKGSLNTIIMRLLDENGRMYGYEITQRVKEITKGELQITEGALYPALHKLEAEGLLDVEVEKVDGRLRKYYKLTEKGTKETVSLLADLEEFIRNMQTIVKPSLGY